MTERSQIIDAIYVAVENTNEALPDDAKIEARESTVIHGNDSTVDSLGFVSLMVSIEQEVESVIGSCPSLVELLSDSSSDVSTLGEIADFIAKRV